MLTITKKLDMSPHGVPQVIRVSQYDSDFTLEFKLFASGGNFAISTGTTAEIRGTKQSGTGYSASATLDTSTKVVTVAGAAQMTAVAGMNIYEIVLKKNNKEISSANFCLMVERAALDADTITDESVLKELNAIIESADTATQAAEEAEDAADRAEAAAQSLVIDSTLTQSGQPADAKATGDAIAGLEDEIGVFRWNRKCLIALNTDPVNLTPIPNLGIDSVVIDCVADDKFVVTASGGNQSRAWGFLDSNNHVLSVADANIQVNELELTAPTNTAKLVANNKTVDGTGRVYKIGNNLESRIANLEDGTTAVNPILNSGVGIILASLLGKLSLKDPSYSYITSNIAKLFNDDAPIDSQNVIESIQYIPFNITPYGAKVDSTTYNILRKEVQNLSRFSVNGPLPYNGYRINSMPGYYITVYEIKGDIEFYGKAWNGSNWSSSNTVDGGFGIVSNPSAPWTTTYQNNDSSIKWVQLKFKKENDEVFTPYEFTHMYGTVYTIEGTVPSVEQMLSNIEIGGRGPSVYDDADNVRYMYPTKNNITTRCRTKILPISKGTIVAKDGYSFTAYDVDYRGLQKVADQPDLKANGYPGYVKRHEIFTNSMFVVYVLKKDDNTEFTQSEMGSASNMIGYEGGDVYDVI